MPTQESSESSIQIEFNEAKHTYRVNDRAVPSVTQILRRVIDKSGPLTWWSQRTTLEALCEIHGEDIEGKHMRDWRVGGEE